MQFASVAVAFGVGVADAAAVVPSVAAAFVAFASVAVTFPVICSPPAPIRMGA